MNAAQQSRKRVNGFFATQDSNPKNNWPWLRKGNDCEAHTMGETEGCARIYWNNNAGVSRDQKPKNIEAFFRSEKIRLNVSMSLNIVNTSGPKDIAFILTKRFYPVILSPQKSIR